MTISDAPNCGVTNVRHYDDCNSFIIQATDLKLLVQGSRSKILFWVGPNSKVKWNLSLLKDEIVDEIFFYSV